MKRGEAPSRQVKDWQILTGGAREGQCPSRMRSIIVLIVFKFYSTFSVRPQEGAAKQAINLTYTESWDIINAEGMV